MSAAWVLRNVIQVGEEGPRRLGEVGFRAMAKLIGE
jgi:hypothetical protein